jgi:transposase-like protein
VGQFAPEYAASLLLPGNCGKVHSAKAFELLPLQKRSKGTRCICSDAYTTNPVEALHRIVRKLIKSKAAWVLDATLVKQVFLSLMHNEKSWRRRAYGWKSIQRTIMETYPERVKPWI